MKGGGFLHILLCAQAELSHSRPMPGAGLSTDVVTEGSDFGEER